VERGEPILRLEASRQTTLTRGWKRTRQQQGRGPQETKNGGLPGDSKKGVREGQADRQKKEGKKKTCARPDPYKMKKKKKTKGIKKRIIFGDDPQPAFGGKVEERSRWNEQRGLGLQLPVAYSNTPKTRKKRK